jgi:hypothetical protein
LTTVFPFRLGTRSPSLCVMQSRCTQ